jgi:hypothetical protein
MKLLRAAVVVGCLFAAAAAGVVLERTGVADMASKTTYYRTIEPMLIAAESESKTFHVLPAGTPIYYDKSFAEGHSRYIIYANFKGDLQAEKIESDKPNLIDPIWLYQVEKADLPKLIGEVPISKSDLVKIMKARKMTREDLAQIVREWTD